jgi:hypothetical protein
MQNSQTWYTTKIDANGVEVIDLVQKTREGEKPVPANKNWKLSPTGNTPHEETPAARYDENMRYLTDEEWLKKQGKKDPRGRWYHKDRTKQDVTILNADSAAPGDEYTQEPPLENEAHQKFDEQKKKWVVDKVKKERADKEERLAKLKTQVNELETKALRPQREKDLGIDVEKSKEKILEIQTAIEELRPEIKALENELKSA